jgi:hypothetical protein
LALRRSTRLARGRTATFPAYFGVDSQFLDATTTSCMQLVVEAIKAYAMLIGLWHGQAGAARLLISEILMTRLEDIHQ